MATIRGTITLDDGSVSEFVIYDDGSAIQWGADTERLGLTVEHLEAMVAGLEYDELVNHDL